MKKIFLIITAIIAAGCSTDTPYNGDSGGEEYTLLKKKVVTAPDGSQITTQYSYDGNKLISTTSSNGTNEAYAYTENYITEVRHYANGGLVEKEEFTYSASGLATHITHYYDLANPSNNNAVKYEYSYNGATITANKFTGDDSGQTTPDGSAVIQVTSNGNITQYQSGTLSINYSFDINSNPMRQVLGYQAIILAGFEGGANNITTVQTNNNGSITNTLYTFTYESDYPATSNYTNSSGAVYTAVYTY